MRLRTAAFSNSRRRIVSRSICIRTSCFSKLPDELSDPATRTLSKPETHGKKQNAPDVSRECDGAGQPGCQPPCGSHLIGRRPTRECAECDAGDKVHNA